MRTLIISHGHPEFSRGGGEIAAYQQFSEMRKRGYETTFMGAHHENLLEHEGTPFSMLRPNEVLWRTRMEDFFFLKNTDLRTYTNGFHTLLMQLKPDIIHFHHVIHIGIHALRAAHRYRKLAGKPVRIVFTLHEYIFICANNGQMITADRNALCSEANPAKCSSCVKRTPEDLYMREAAFRSCLGLVDHFISPSHFLKKRFVDWGLNRPITVIENGQEAVKKLAPRALENGEARRNFTYIGQINQFKGLHILLQAVANMPTELREQCVINVHGSGLEDQDKGFRDKVSHFFNLLDNVTFHGRYSGEELPGILKNADTVVVPSIWWENSPLVIQESFKYGRPIIVSDIGGMAEKVRDRVDGLHFVRGSSLDLTQQMKQMMDVQFWQSCYDALPTPPVIEDTVDQVIGLYKSLEDADAPAQPSSGRSHRKVRRMPNN